MSHPAKNLAGHLRQTLRRWRDDDGSLIAASMAYHAVLAFFPLLLILISAVGCVLRYSGPVHDAREKILQLLAQDSSSALAGHVQNALAQVQSDALLTGPVGVVLLLAAGVGLFTQLDKAMDRIWGTGRPRSAGVLVAIRVALVYRLRAYLMLLGLGVLVLVALVANLVAAALRPWTTDVVAGGWVWGLARTAASVAANTALLAGIYRVVPKVRVPWTAALQGGLLAAALWEISRQVLSLAVFGHRYTMFGLVGSLLILMVWVYLASAIFVFSAEFVRLLRDNSAEPPPREPGGRSQSGLPRTKA